MSSQSERFPARFFTIGLGAIFLILLGFQLHWFSTDPWLSVRLAPSFQMATGMPIYPTPQSGPYSMTLYGFVNPLFYLPWTWITDADWALRISGLWTILWTLGLGVVLVRGTWQFSPLRDELPAVERRFLLALFCLVVIAIPALRYSLLEIHADAPAHVLVLLACLAILRFHRTAKWSWLIVAGLAGGTAPWAKQLALFPLLGAIVWIWRARGWKPVCIFCATCGAVGAGWFVLGSALYGADVVWFNIWTVPNQQPWLLDVGGVTQWVFDPAGKLLALGALIYRRIIWEYGPALVLLVFVVFAARKWGKARAGLVRLESPVVGLFFWTAIGAIPGSMLGLVKVGGDLNSASFFLYNACICIFAGLAILTPKLREEGVFIPLSKAAFSALALVSLFMVADRARLIKWPSHRHLQAYLREHPGTVYCPFDPLVHVMVEKKSPPVSDILLSMQLSGRKVTELQFRTQMSGYESLQYVVYPHFASGEEFVKELLPDYSEKTSLPELPGFRVYRRPSVP